MKSLSQMLFAASLCFCSPFAQARQPSQSNQLSCESLASIVLRLRTEHMAPPQGEEERTRRAADLMMRRLDFSRSLMTEAEAKDFEKQLQKSFQTLLNKNQCRDFNKLYQKIIQYHERAEAYTRKLLSDDQLQIDRTVELLSDAEKRPKPKTDAEREELLRKLLHFQLANYQVMGTDLAEAKKKLIHRYELNTKRAKELSEQDRYAIFLDCYALGFDPHSGYMSADDLIDFNISMNLALEGIGATLFWRDGYTSVEELSPGGPAARQGQLQPKDRILAVAQGEDGEPQDVVDMDLKDVVKLVRGPKGSKVRLTVLRQGAQTETLNIVITRDKIDLTEQAAQLTWHTVTPKKDAGPNAKDSKPIRVAVIKLPSFYGGSGFNTRRSERDMLNLLKEAVKQKADALVLDLSINGGGLLSSAVDISGLFLKEGAIVGVEGSGYRQILEDDEEHIPYAGPMVLVTSKGSASASEILAGAMKDYHRAVIVGDERTFGKGTVQNVIPLPAGYGALKATSSVFFRPSGVSTQSAGVASDIVLPSYYSEEDEGESELPYALKPATTKPFMSDKVQGNRDTERFTPIDEATVARLNACAQKRVKASSAFAEIETELKKHRDNAGMLKISEILDNNKSDEDDRASRMERLESLSPQVLEAINIAADLVNGGCLDESFAVPAESKGILGKIIRKIRHYKNPPITDPKP